jgi:hypothetical protein
MVNAVQLIGDQTAVVSAPRVPPSLILRYGRKVWFTIYLTA